MNALLGVVLMFAPFMTGASLWLMGFSFLMGAALIALSIPKGDVDQNYDDWNRLIV